MEKETNIFWKFKLRLFIVCLSHWAIGQYGWKKNCPNKFYTFLETWSCVLNYDDKFQFFDWENFENIKF